MTATTLRAQPSQLAGHGISGGDAQERAATNPVAALPCAPTPLLAPLSLPLLRPLLGPSAATVGVRSPLGVRFGLVRGIDPGPGGRPPPPPPPPPAGVSGGLAGHWSKAARWRVCCWSAPHQPRGGPPAGQPGSPSPPWLHVVVGWVAGSSPAGVPARRPRTGMWPRWRGSPSSTRSAPTRWGCCWAGCRPSSPAPCIAGTTPQANTSRCPRSPRRPSAITCAAGTAPAGCGCSGRWAAPGSSPPAPASTSQAAVTGPGPWSPASSSICTRSRWSAWRSRPPTPTPNGCPSGPLPGCAPNAGSPGGGRTAAWSSPTQRSTAPARRCTPSRSS
jgi:hypothetical protein